MSKLLAACVATLLSMGLLPATAQASDTCFTDNSGITLVAKGFKFPSRNRCVPWQGEVYSFTLGSMEPWVVTGSACVDNGGDTLRVAFSYYNYDHDGANHWGQMDIPLPSKKGGNAYYGDSVHPGSGTQVGGDVAIVPCEPLIIPLR